MFGADSAKSHGTELHGLSALRETGSNAANVTDGFAVVCSRRPEQVRDPNATRSIE